MIDDIVLTIIFFEGIEGVITNIEIIPRSQHNLILIGYLSYGVVIRG